jgi:Spy/CpxP family protein refolding chaperone
MLREFKMNKLVFVGLIFLTTLGVGLSQSPDPVAGQSVPGSHGHQKGWVREQEILSKLNLTLNQKEQVKNALKILRKGAKDLKSQSGLITPEELKSKRKALKKSYIESVKGILTPAEFEKYRQIHKEMRKAAQAKKAGLVPTPL